MTVSKKILAISVFSSTLTLGCLSGVMLIRDVNSFADRKIEQLSSVGTIVGANTEAALTFSDPYTAEDYLQSLKNEPDITEAILFDVSKEVFAAYSRNPDETLTTFPTFTGSLRTTNEVCYVHPIIVNNDQIGTLLIKADNQSLREKFKQSLIISITVFIGGIMITVLLAYGMQFLISKPLVSLSDLAHKVSRQQDYSIRASKLYDDEVGSLVDSFNFMLENVQQRDEAIQESHRNLEAKVTERTTQLQVAMEDAMAASRAKSEFLATMSHELRTPMNAIVGMASMLSDSDIDDERRGYIQLIRKSSDALLGLVNDVLDYSKIEAGRLDLEANEFELLDCLESAMGIVAAQVPETKLSLFTSVDPQAPRWIVGDTTRLRQILVNLIGNAVKFTDKGYVWLRLTSFQDNDTGKTNRLKLDISDTGIGIPQERMKRLFQSFTQVDSTTTRKFGGTGLGLAISQKLSQAMGGSIEVESKPNFGSVFSVHIPVIQSGGEGEILGHAPWKKGITPIVKIENINTPIRQCIAKVLNHWGATVIENDEKDHAPQTLDLKIKGCFCNDLNSEPLEAQLSRFKNDPKPTLYITQQAYWTILRACTKSPITTMPFNVEDFRSNLTALLKPHHQFENQKDEIEEVIPDSQLESPLKILLVEDNPINRKVFALMLKKMRLQADNAINGEEALDAVKKTKYDIVFMDYHMPLMDGIEATQKIRALKDTIDQPIIYGFTANVQTDTVDEMQKAGVDSYISKPVKITDLHNIFDQLKTSMQLEE